MFILFLYDLYFSTTQTPVSFTLYFFYKNINNKTISLNFES